MDVVTSEKTVMLLAVSRLPNLKEQQQKRSGHHVYVNLNAYKRKQVCCHYVFLQTTKLALCYGRTKPPLILISKLQRDLHRNQRDSREKIVQ